MAEQFDETLEDYLARLNIEGGRKTFYKNRKNIDFILRKTKADGYKENQTRIFRCKIE